jgi:hypothetical protein
MQKRNGGRVAIGLLLLLGTACNDCDRDGCEAMTGSAGDTGKSGVAGAVASESDVSANGCQQCGFGSSSLDFWKTAGEATGPAGASVVMKNGPPDGHVDANAHYSIALEPGTYLVCADSQCANLTVHPNHVTTLNVLRLLGPARFFVVDPGAPRAREASGFAVSG